MTSGASEPFDAPDYSTLERMGAMQKALNRALDYRALADAAMATAAGSNLERVKALQTAAAEKWIALAEHEERRAETSRTLIETR